MADDVNEDAIETAEQEMPPSHAVLMLALEWQNARAAAMAEAGTARRYDSATWAALVKRRADAEAALSAAVVTYEKWRADPPKLRA